MQNESNLNIVDISVLMSVYNEPLDWIKQAIDSILNQSLTKFEFIIINDKPDRLENKILLQRYLEQDSRIKIIENAKNIGLTKSLNIGLKQAKGKYIARMDADDISMKNRLRVQYNFMQKNQDYVLVGSNMILFGDVEGEKVFYPEDNDDIKLNLLIKNTISHPTVLIRKSILINNKLRYNEKAIYSQDLLLWSELSVFGKFKNLQDFLLKYRKSSSQISSSKLDEQSLIANEAIKDYYYNQFQKLKINSKKYYVYNKLGVFLFNNKKTPMEILPYIFNINYFRLIYSILKRNYKK